MSLAVDLARVSALANIVLLFALAYVWGTNYLQIRSKQTLGNLVFVVFLFGENALALYYYVTAVSLPAAAMQAMMFLSVLETLGLAFLAYVTYD